MFSHCKKERKNICVKYLVKGIPTCCCSLTKEVDILGQPIHLYPDLGLFGSSASLHFSIIQFAQKNAEGNLAKKGKEFQIVKYIKDVLTKEELLNIIKLLDIKPIDLVRKNETIWKENFKNKNLNDGEIIIAMLENPKLIERPIVINNNKAVIGRPVENISKIL